MREVGLYGLLHGAKKTAKKFGYNEKDVKMWVLKAFDDPFIQVLREIIKSSLNQVGIHETSKTFKLSQESLQLFAEFHHLSPNPPNYGHLSIEEWYKVS